MLNVAAFVGLAFALLRPTSAQITSNATCLTSFSGLYNSKGQSPCLVAAYLGGACNGGQYDVSALNPGEHYIGPTSAIVNQCQCSTVMYSMMGGCSACQNATIISWDSWSAACSSVYVDIFPQDIPSGTAVPGWAYENVTASADDTFNPQSALADNAPESTATHVQSTQTAAGSSTSGAASASAVPSSSGEKKSSSHAGAIAGGIVGGVVGVALIALVAFLLIRRSRNKRFAGPTALGGGSPVPQEKVDPQYQAVPYAPTPTSPPAGGFLAQQPKLYDPNDPSTFPTSPAPQTVNSQYSGSGYYNQSQTQYSSPQVPQPQTYSSNNQGMYRGVAEV